MLNSGGHSIDFEGFITQRLSEDKLLIVPEEVSAQIPPRVALEVHTMQNKVKKLKSIKMAKLPSKTQFILELSDNSVYRELLGSIEDLERNELKKAKSRLLKIIASSKEEIKQAQTKIEEKQSSVICIQAFYYLSKVQQSEGLIEEAIATQNMILQNFDIADLHIKGQLMLSLGNLYRILLKFQEAAKNFYQALILYERLNWKVQQADCLLQLGIVYALLSRQFNYCQDDYEPAKLITYEALEIYRENIIENNIKVGNAYYTLGKIFYYSKAFEVATEYLLKSLKIHSDYYQNEYDFNFVKIYNLLGIVYQVQHQLDVAIDYFTLAVRCYRGSFDAQLGQILNNIGVAYLGLKELELASDFFNNADQVYSIYFEQTNILRKRVKLNLESIKAHQ
ncbi:unnamed protein product (macronuclear) [Paramecium tetraurelia]|uniref:Uncharacterized protein n=1 Tax=Paramecium tetraurelia TaxID=5888 RepID=A0BDT9_PARTE|nr:uncharacterized protein GSPATT00027736001 [Paramecium tetraurelia]CAK56706.1 unnamed protein product [Paramecium tetraurelia]|eukprot:XP_001424104.1 hypothetical protein (macronuclear) [Paramecium tetraurelia strain d4-2]